MPLAEGRGGGGGGGGGGGAPPPPRWGWPGQLSTGWVVDGSLCIDGDTLAGEAGGWVLWS
ncbi:hypothetical protein [Nocardia abscessus]|uniref:hypothetical protein n=1 Tax=Nocardia abscessus TaxID=120957 RepID=UPI0024591158|nr:hypothetical protein [Nocardia abscessus]